MDAPRDSLVRMMTAIEVRADGDGRTLIGYAAVFNEDTVIDSWEGNFVERIVPGAFKKTLRERGNQIKVLFNHGMDPTVGDKPLGKPRVMREDSKGLYVEVPLDRTSYNEDLIASIQSGALDGMSFRFSVTKESWSDPKNKKSLPVRTIEEIKLYEFGPVTFPAYAATAAGIRSREEFSIWLALPEEKRAAIQAILGTEITEAGSTTSGVAAATAATIDEPAPGHSRFTQARARAALIARGIPHVTTG